MAGATDSTRKPSTSFDLKRAPMTFCRRLEAELDEVRKSKGAQQEDDEVQVEEGKDDDVGGDGQVRREGAEVDRARAADEQQEGGDDEQVALAAVLLAQQRHYGVLGSVRCCERRLVSSAVPAMRPMSVFSPLRAAAANTRT